MSYIDLTKVVAPSTPSTDHVDLYIDTADKRLKSIDDVPTTIVFTGNSTTDTLTNKTLTGPLLTAGTASVAPLNFASGTNLTSATTGAMEFDGVSPYFSVAASSRGVLDTEQIITLTSTYTLASQTAAQKLFNATTNGAVTVTANTTFLFECLYSLSSMSVTPGSFGFTLGGTANISGQGWWAMADKAVLATAGTPSITYNTAANATLVTASAATTGFAIISGKFRVTTAGTIIPQVSLGVAAAAVVGVDSYFRLWPIGSNTVTSVGNWS